MRDLREGGGVAVSKGYTKEDEREGALLDELTSIYSKCREVEIRITLQEFETSIVSK